MENAHDDIDRYCEFVRGSTDLKLGIEADFIPGREEQMRALLERQDWDYVVGSIHFLADGALDYDRFDVWNSARSADHVWKTYFTWLGELAASGMFDILAHPDLVKHWGKERPWPEKDLRFYYDLAMEQIAESGIAIELSTAGLRKPVGEIYPDRAFLEMVVDAGNPIALSSDAHTPEQLGFEYDQALELLDDVGVTEIARLRAPQRDAWRRSGRMSTVRTGIGWDSHKLVADRKLILGGVELEHSHGLLGHSDADVLTHAIIDALLGAAGLDDIGAHFPDTDAAYKDADSLVLLRDVVARVAGAGFRDRPRRRDGRSWSARSSRRTAGRSAPRSPRALGLDGGAGQREGVDRRGPRLRRPGRGRRRAGGRHARARISRTSAFYSSARMHGELVVLAVLVGVGAVPPARRADADPVPDPADGRRDARSAFVPGVDEFVLDPDIILVVVPAAAALRRRVLHVDPGSARQLQADRAARGRAASPRRRSPSPSSPTRSSACRGRRRSCSARSSRRPTRSPPPRSPSARTPRAGW